MLTCKFLVWRSSPGGCTLINPLLVEGALPKKPSTPCALTTVQARDCMAALAQALAPGIPLSHFLTAAAPATLTPAHACPQTASQPLRPGLTRPRPHKLPKTQNAVLAT